MYYDVVYVTAEGAAGSQRMRLEQIPQWLDGHRARGENILIVRIRQVTTGLNQGA